MRPINSFVALIAVLCLIGAGGALAQTNGPSLTLVALDDSTFPILTIQLGVVDAAGRPVTGLTASSVEVLEDGSPAEIVSVRDVSDTAQAIAVVIVIDVSDSMAGSPLAAAKASAVSFVQGLGPDDEVAVLAFGSTVREAQPFTTDKAQAQSAIERLETSGTTALYDAANQGVLTAARSALARRVVVLLGDGAEYGGASLSQADDAYEAARSNGVTIHTIALGFNADTSYFQKLSGLTGGAALNAPTPDELDAQWDEISSLLRQLVEVVVKSSVPGDGQTHTLLIRVKTGGGQAEVTGTFKSSAVPPKVTIAGLDSTLKNPATITANVDAQGQVTAVTFTLDGDLLSRDSASPFTAELDPASLSAGTHTLAVEAADESGTTGSAEVTFTVAALPPRVSLSLKEGQKIDAPLSITPEVVSQSESNTVAVTIDGKAAETLTTPPYRFTLDPAKLGSGAHTLAVTVTDSNGQSAFAEVGFTVVSSSTVGGGPAIWIIAVAAVVVVAVVAGAIIVRRRPAAPAPPAPAMRLEVLAGPDKGKVFPVTDEKQIIGRLSTAGIPLNDPTGGLHLSREHARVWKSGGAAYIEDAGSRYGVTVNGRRIAEPTPLTNDALIKVGEVEMIFHGPAPTAGDLRATQFGPGVLPTMIAETEAEPPAPLPEKTMLVETAAETKKTPAPEEDEETRRTRLKREAESPETRQPDTQAEPEGDAIRNLIISRTQLKTETRPDDDETETRRTRLKGESEAGDDEEERRRTRLKPGDDDDENRSTRMKKE